MSLPGWLPLALATVAMWGLWGFLARVASDSLDARLSAALQGIGVLLVTLVLLAIARPALDALPGRGAAAALAAGIALALGLLAFAGALALGGRASIVVPLTALYPLVTVALAVTLLRESLTPVHVAGVAFALLAAVLLSRSQ